MAKLIDGEAPELEKSDLEGRVKDIHDDFLNIIKENITCPELDAVYQNFKKKYRKLGKKARIKKLEQTLRQAGEIYHLLESERKENLGYLTTIYILHKHTPDKKGVIKLNNLNFLKKFGLEKADYVLSGLSNAFIKNISIEGHDCLQKAQNVAIEEIIRCGVEFAKDSKGVKIKEIVASCKEFGNGSEEMKIERIKNAGDYFGKETKRMKIGTVQKAENGFGKDSEKMVINGVDYAEQDFGKNSKKLRVTEVKKAAWGFGVNSKNLYLGKIEKAGSGFGGESVGLQVDLVGFSEGSFGYSSKNMKIKKIKQASSEFGRGSEKLAVDYAAKAGNDFGKNSKKMKVGTVKYAGNGFGRGSEELKARLIKKAEKSFGLESKGMEVEKLEEVERENFLLNSEQAIIFQLQDACPSGIQSTNYVIRNTAGRIYSDMGVRAIEILKEKFNFNPYQDTLDLLKVKKDK